MVTPAHNPAADTPVERCIKSLDSSGSSTDHQESLHSRSPHKVQINPEDDSHCQSADAAAAARPLSGSSSPG